MITRVLVTKHVPYPSNGTHCSNKSFNSMRAAWRVSFSYPMKNGDGIHICTKKMSDIKASVGESSHPMNSGDGTHSYARNSYYQRSLSSFVNTMIDVTVVEKLDIESLILSSNTFTLADLGCSVGPNTFIAMQHLVQTIKHKYMSQNLASCPLPEFQVFFNDHASNDFNTLFTSLPLEREYLAAGVPGSFYGRLFPKSSLHFVYSSYALHWLSRVPEKCLDFNSPAYNKGRIFYLGAPDAVKNAYAAQFDRDMEVYLDARANELVVGGMMVLIMPSIPESVPCSNLASALFNRLTEYSLHDMAKQGIIQEAEIDAFNLPIYGGRQKEMVAAIERNGCFSIERMEMTSPSSKLERPINKEAWIMHYRAVMEGVYARHFGYEKMDQLFDRLLNKTREFSADLESSYMEKTQLFVVLKRI